MHIKNRVMYLHQKWHLMKLCTLERNVRILYIHKPPPNKFQVLSQVLQAEILAQKKHYLLRSRPQTTSAHFSDFMTPLPPSLSSSYEVNFNVFDPPSLPFWRDVDYGWPLSNYVDNNYNSHAICISGYTYCNLCLYISIILFIIIFWV